MNSLEELNKYKINESVSVWDFVNGQRNLKISQNSKDKISILEFSAQVGNQIYFSEYTMDKSNLDFVKGSLALANFEEVNYDPFNQNQEEDYGSKLNILMNKK